MKKRELTDAELEAWQEEMHGRKQPKEEKKSKPAAPVQKKSASAAPITLEGRNAKKQLKPFGKQEATLDLHGYNKLDAHDATKTFLKRAQASGKRHVLIITGKGKGILRTSVPHWLEDWPELVSAIAPSAPEKGGEGALHVLLRKKR